MFYYLFYFLFYYLFYFLFYFSLPLRGKFLGGENFGYCSSVLVRDRNLIRDSIHFLHSSPRDGKRSFSRRESSFLPSKRGRKKTARQRFFSPLRGEKKSKPFEKRWKLPPPKDVRIRKGVIPHLLLPVFVSEHFRGGKRK